MPHPTMLARALIGDRSDFAVTRCDHQDLDTALSKGAKHNHDTIKKIPRPSSLRGHRLGRDGHPG
jgi:hypothetical protein